MILALPPTMFLVHRGKQLRSHVASLRFWLITTLLILLPNTPTSAQYLSPGSAPGGGSSPVSIALAPQLPGSLWLNATGANHGLGYDDSYFSLGGKRRLFSGPLQARWLSEVHAHVTEDSGKPFANFGLERVQTLAPAGIDYGVNLWFDIDDDQLEYFGHTFYQIGVGGFVKTKHFDLRTNGYIPTGTTGYELAHESCFYQNNIVIQGGMDAALEGFDSEIRFRPRKLAMHYGYIDFGGYYYNSADNLISAFSGLRTRIGLHPVPGIGLSFELNNDSRFKTTGFLRFELAFGGGDRVHGNSAASSRDLERTVRNDHIVRFQQDVLFAMDPDTNLPYFVHHVDNTASNNGDGSVNNPHDTLIDAELASSPEDIIFVREGDGTLNGMNAGITLQDGQLFLGDGVEHWIPLAGGGTFLLCNDLDGIMPTISADPGFDVVTLADRNTVAGFDIDGENIARHGIFGRGTQVLDGAITNTTIHDNVISNVVQDGIHLEDIDGATVIDSDAVTVISDESTTIEDNTIFAVGDDGIDITGVVGTENTIVIAGNTIADPNVTDTETVSTASIVDDGIAIGSTAAENDFLLEKNIIGHTGGNGIHLMDITDTELLAGGTWMFIENKINGLGEQGIGSHGILVERFLDAETELQFLYNESHRAQLDGMHLEDVQVWKLDVYGNLTNNNLDDGLELVNTSDPNDPLFSVNVDIVDHTSNFNLGDGIAVQTGNGDLTIIDSVITNNRGDGIDIENFTNNVAGTGTLISTSLITDNGAGVTAGIRYSLNQASTVPTDQIENLTITGNTIDGNGINIMTLTSGEGTALDTNIVDNPSIAGFVLDGINVQSLAGATQTLDISDNLIDGVNLTDPNDPNDPFIEPVTSTGIAIRVLVDDQDTGLLTTVTGTVIDNEITNQGGQGVEEDIDNLWNPSVPIIGEEWPNVVSPSGVGLTVNGESFLDMAFTSNEFNASQGSHLTAQFDVSNTTVINRLDLRNNIFNDTSEDDSIIVQTADNTRLDMNITGNDILAATEEGFELNLADDTFTRADFTNNTWTDSPDDTADDGTTGGNALTGAEDIGESGHALFVTTENNAQFLMTFHGNEIEGYGGAGQLDTIPPDPAWGEGVDISAIDSSKASVRATNNSIRASALEGMRLEVDDTANINAFVQDNFFRYNDRAFSDPNEPQFERDFIADKVNPISSLCLALHNNFSNTGENFLVRNAGGSFIQLEEGINTPQATTEGSVNVTAFDETTSPCILNIEAEEAVFTAAGFP